jgi:hypothetical protein
LAKPARPYLVTRHDPLEQLDDNLWAVNGDVPGFPAGVGFHRRMSIVRLSDGRLLFWNAVPVDDATLAQISALGKPAVLVLPHHLHMLDARAFRERLGLAVYTSARALAEVGARTAVDGTLETMAVDPAISPVLLPSSRLGEPALVVHSGPRASLLLCDVVTNVPDGRGLVAGIFRLLGFTGPTPRLPPIVRLRAFPDRAAVRADLERLAATPGLVRVVPSHGPVITDDPAGALRQVARSL